MLLVLYVLAYIGHLHRGGSQCNNSYS